MKTLSLFILSVFTVITTSAQYNNRRHNNNYRSTVTIVLRGNTNDQVLVDGRSYSSGYSNSGNNLIRITDLQAGPHTLQVIENNTLRRRIHNRRNNFTNINTTFNVRNGYDMRISLNANGRAQIRETRNRQ